MMSNTGKISTALALMNSMILSGEEHTDISRKVLAEALDELKEL